MRVRSAAQYSKVVVGGRESTAEGTSRGLRPGVPPVNSTDAPILLAQLCSQQARAQGAGGWF